MKLGRLAHLEKIELNDEKKELTSTIAKCTEIIGNVDKQKEIYLERFNAFAKKYRSPRKTELTHIEIKPEENGYMVLSFSRAEWDTNEKILF